jgi:PKD repeat protein
MSSAETITSTSQNPVATFTTGTYPIRLWTNNSIGGSWANTTTITVAAGAPTAQFSGTPTSGDKPLSVQFTDLSTNTPTSWLWEFSDGGSTNIQNPEHPFVTVGTHTVKLTAYNSYGSDSEEKVAYITVNEIPPVAAFTADHVTGNAPFTVIFTDSSENTPTSWNWSFGDGTYNTTQNPTHTYTTLGSFTVVLNATNAIGSDLETKSGYINVVAYPTITYTPSPTPTPTYTVAPSGAGPQISTWSYGSGGVTLTVTGVTGSDVWAIYGQVPGKYAWITSNATASSGNASVPISGGALLGNRLYYTKACDPTGCGNEATFTTATITPAPATTYGNAYKNITGMR